MGKLHRHMFLLILFIVLLTSCSNSSSQSGADVIETPQTPVSLMSEGGMAETEEQQTDEQAPIEETEGMTESATEDALSSLYITETAEEFEGLTIEYELPISLRYTSVYTFSEGYAAAMTNPTPHTFANIRYALINPKGEDVLPMNDGPWGVSFVNEGFVGVRSVDGKWGFINLEANTGIASAYDELSEMGDESYAFYEGLARVAYRQEDYSTLYGFIDTDFNVVASAQYHYAHDFSDGMAAVFSYQGKYGFIDKTGKEVIPPQYDKVHDFREGLAYVESPDGRGFIDKSGKLVIPTSYDEVEDFHQGLASVSKDGKCGFIDKSGELVIPFTFDVPDDWNPYRFENGYASVEIDGLYGAIDRQGNIVVPIEYDCYHKDIPAAGYQVIIDRPCFSNGRIIIQKNGKFGFADSNGEEIIPPQYDTAEPFSEGFAVVGIDGKQGYIDIHGNPATGMIYEFAHSFNGGYAAVSAEDTFNDKIFWGVLKISESR